ncbi:MAG: hypothetical protein KH296_05365 [Ruminococcus sp.]|nr:hypothetical protein [Ruminococcus sp.]
MSITKFNNLKNLYDKPQTSILYDLTIQNNNHFDFTSSISSAHNQANMELQTINETLSSLKSIRPECDKLDYVLAACSGALSGIIDIFLVRKSGESQLENISDKWFADRIMGFAKRCGWRGEGEKSAVRFLEKKYKIPYDQRGRGDAASFIFDLSPSNHHFKSLAHNPTLCGLFFSILDQFSNTSHFISRGELISLEKADDRFELKGNGIPEKLFCGFINWFGHLISDMSGSSTGKGRGMGIPSPFGVWINDIIVIKKLSDIPASQFDKGINELALNIYEKGYDMRFQTAQAIPVFINEMIVRTIYAVRRMLKYFLENTRIKFSFKQMWNVCEPFSNASIKRMLMVAHGTFCVLDIGDAAIHGFMTSGGWFNPVEFFLRFNITGVGRFSVSLYDEGKRALAYWKKEKEAVFSEREKVIVENYIEGLRILAARYNDRVFTNFVEDFTGNSMYMSAFEKTIKLAKLRNVPVQNILQSKSDIDVFFRKG